MEGLIKMESISPNVLASKIEKVTMIVMDKHKIRRETITSLHKVNINQKVD